MYKGKNLKKAHHSVVNKNQQFLITSAIDINNPPNPYEIIKEEQTKARLQKLNKNIPYQWARGQPITPNQNQLPLDPNASITIERAEMSRQGFNREIHQSNSSYGQNSEGNFNMSSNNNRNEQPFRFNSAAINSDFQVQNSNISQNKAINNRGSNWFEQLFQESNSVQNPPPQSNNYVPNNNTSSFNNQYHISNQYNSYNQQNQYSSNNNQYTNNNNQYVNDNNHQYSNNNNQYSNNNNNQYSNNNQYNNNNNQYNQYNQHNNNKTIVSKKPYEEKPFKARDIFKRQQKTQNQPQQQRPYQRNYKNHQKLCGLVQCNKTNKLTTVKILQSIQTISNKNYTMGDPELWDTNNKYPDYLLKDALKHFPHVKEFKNNQKAIIKCALNGNDVFICIPTGGGKSLIFQIMTFIKKGIYLCVLPLVSLIFDQELQAQKYKIEAYSLTGATQINKAKFIFNKIQNYQSGNDSILIFCTPQKIASSQNFVQLLNRIYDKGFLQQVIIDEVHCVSTWGKEFRKQYENLSTLKQFFPEIPVLGLTATVTQKVKQQIIKKLRLKNCFFFQSSFNRPNLMYEVKPKSKRSAVEEICKILDSDKTNSGIIYCLSKKECEQMCKSLNSRGYKTAYYHADLHDKDKREVQLMWMENKIKIIIATIAFGMGINKPDVRFVIHNSLSKSLEGYYQESGRAGRDGLPARCILFYQRSDRTALQSMILKNDYSSAAQKLFSNQQLAQMVKYCEEKYMCRRHFQLSYLGERDFDPANCNKTCDNCKKGLISKEFECITQAKQIVRIVQFIVESKDRITKTQFINTLKGKDQNKYHKVQNYPRLQDIRTIFKFWTIDHLEELMLELLTFEILKEHAISNNVKGIGSVTNIYIEYNQSKSKRFLDQVETFPIRRVVKPQKPERQSSVIQKASFNFEDLFSDSDEEKQSAPELKQRKSDFGDMSYSNDPYDQIDFSNVDEIGIDLGQYQFNEGSDGGQKPIKMEQNQWQSQNHYGGSGFIKGQEQGQKIQRDNKKEDQNPNKQKKQTKSSIQYMMKLFEEDDDLWM